MGKCRRIVDRLDLASGSALTTPVYRGDARWWASLMRLRRRRVRLLQPALLQAGATANSTRRAQQ
ncbi:hypothetical protein ACPA9J_10360 [Pseudomonas aeruginosa]